MDIISNLYKKFIDQEIDKKAALKRTKEIAFRSTDEKCKRCESKECFSGEYGPFCPMGMYRGN